MLETTATNARKTGDVPAPNEWPGPAWSPSVGPVSVVIPAMNEERNISWVLERMPPAVAEVILVDGRSSDATVSVARSVHPDLVVVSEPRRGKGRALRTGFDAASGDVIVMIDADGSMDPSEIPRYVDPLVHYDFVKGSRYIVGGDSDDFTWVRRLGNRGLLAFANVLFGSPFTDLCYGFCSFRRDCLDDLALTASGFEIETQLVVHAIKAGLRIKEIPSVELSRICGESNLHTFRDGQRVLRTLVMERFERSRNGSSPISARVAAAVAGVDPDAGGPARLAPRRPR